jgi:hypothetical protein
MTPGKPTLARFRCALPVTLRKRSGPLELLTSDVSFRDVFVRTDAPPPANSLVRLDLTVPPEGAVISVSAAVDAVVPATPAAEHYPGFLARLVGLSGPPKARWDSFVASLRQDHPEADRTTVVFARRSYVDRFQKKTGPSVSVVYRPSSVEALTAILTVATHGGLLAVPTPMAIVLGAPVDLQLVHPITEDTVTLPGTVKRRDADGVSVEVPPQPEEGARALQEFADSVVVIAEYDLGVFSSPALT